MGTRVDEVEAALRALLKKKLKNVQTVKALTAGDLDDTLDVIVQPPAVLLLFTGEVLDPRRDHLRLTYQSGIVFTVLVGTSNLRGSEDERRAGHKLLNDCDDILAGARIVLPGSSQRPIVSLGRADLWQFDEKGTWYGRQIVVESVAQFSGVAAA